MAMCGWPPPAPAISRMAQDDFVVSVTKQPGGILRPGFVPCEPHCIIPKHAFFLFPLYLRFESNTALPKLFFIYSTARAIFVPRGCVFILKNIHFFFAKSSKKYTHYICGVVNNGRV